MTDTSPYHVVTGFLFSKSRITKFCLSSLPVSFFVQFFSTVYQLMKLRCVISSYSLYVIIITIIIIIIISFMQGIIYI